MYQITNIINHPNQIQSISLPDGGSFVLHLVFQVQQKSWFINELTYNDVTIRGLRLSLSRNLLRQFSNLVPFGLAVISSTEREPFFIDDLSSEAVKLFVLTSEEVDYVERIYSE